MPCRESESLFRLNVIYGREVATKALADAAMVIDDEHVDHVSVGDHTPILPHRRLFHGEQDLLDVLG